MTTATVTVQYLNAPAAGKKQWNIKTTEGAYYQVPVSIHGDFKPGGTYEITYEESEYNNRTYRTIKAVKPVAPAVQAAGGGAPQAGGYQTYRETSDKDAQRMYVTAITVAYIKAGKVDLRADSLVAVGKAAQAAFHHLYGQAAPPAQKPKPTAADEMDDEIPF